MTNTPTLIQEEVRGKKRFYGKILLYLQRTYNFYVENIDWYVQSPNFYVMIELKFTNALQVNSVKDEQNRLSGWILLVGASLCPSDVVQTFMVKMEKKMGSEDGE